MVLVFQGIYRQQADKSADSEMASAIKMIEKPQNVSLAESPGTDRNELCQKGSYMFHQEGYDRSLSATSLLDGET